MMSWNVLDGDRECDGNVTFCVGTCHRQARHHRRTDPLTDLFTNIVVVVSVCVLVIISRVERRRSNNFRSWSAAMDATTLNAANPVLQGFSFYSSILILKMLGMSLLTAFHRIRKKVAFSFITVRLRIPTSSELLIL